jgi:hypothetical protein
MLTQDAQICAGANMVYLRADRVFILEHYFASKLFSAVREQTIAIIDPEILHKVARNTLKWVEGREGSGHFQYVL